MSEQHRLSKFLDCDGNEDESELDFRLQDELKNNVIDMEFDNNPISEDVCVECEDHVFQVFCEQCHDYYCELCYESQHRKGKRKNHTFQPVVDTKEDCVDKNVDSTQSIHNADDDEVVTPVASRGICSVMTNFLLGISNTESSAAPQVFRSTDTSSYLERAKYIPLRLSYEERKKLRALEAALSVSEYTNKLDSPELQNPSKRLRMQLQEICGFLSGLIIANDYNQGQKVVQEKDFSEYSGFFQEMFELGRRYKIMNPEKMRGEYGKLMYLLRDANSTHLQELLGFSCHSPIRTVYKHLESRNCLNLLQDPKLPIATMVVAPDGKTRSQIQKEIKQKGNCVTSLSTSYESDEISADEIELCLYSIADNNYYLYFDRDPIDRMIEYLTCNFSPTEIRGDRSLAIQSGNDGARLSHDHERQYHYVMQSLSLWREIAHDMFRLWYLTDEDLLEKENAYQLTDTGQGLHRVQNAPRVSRALHVILHETQRRLGHWVGSSVIHLGDKNVPNALIFIDKYTQVGHILRPIVKTIEDIDRLYEDNQTRVYIDSTFSGKENLKLAILADFFREAFDGSGADNFFDAGSCIDGRLTSAWNWCSNLHTKTFYPVFKLSGFVGFDGKFG